MTAHGTPNNVVVTDASPPAAPDRPDPRRPRSTKGLARGMRVDDADLAARRRAACVLEVLAGVRAPEEAAAALALPLAGYFQLEEKALRGLVEGCGPQPRGRSPDLTRALEESKRRIGELEREVQRHQALLRSAQRSAGLMGSLVGTVAGTARPSTAAAKAVKPSGRRPKVRALRAVAALRGDASVAAVSVTSEPMPTAVEAPHATPHPTTHATAHHTG
ncbi:MAG: hypothetical protein JNM94_12855 [Phycisphaerae bacterium]|nr:hypothetical protein [Phycisphaerae bacterium]